MISIDYILVISKTQMEGGSGSIVLFVRSTDPPCQRPIAARRLAMPCSEAAPALPFQALPKIIAARVNAPACDLRHASVMIERLIIVYSKPI